MFIVWSEMYCAVVVRFHPTSRVVWQICRETTMETLGTNEKPLTSQSNKLNPEKNRLTQFRTPLSIQNGLLNMIHLTNPSNRSLS